LSEHGKRQALFLRRSFAVRGIYNALISGLEKAANIPNENHLLASRETPGTHFLCRREKP